jgi:hypothetical protein
LQCDGGRGRCVDPKYCSNSSQTYGGGLFQPRNNFEIECSQHSLYCCPLGDVLAEPTRPKIEGCGHRNVNGVDAMDPEPGEAEYGEFPWMVVVLQKTKVQGEMINLYTCGGSLIHHKVILTGECYIRKLTSKIFLFFMFS